MTRYDVLEGTVSTMKMMVMILNILITLVFSLSLTNIACSLACATVLLFKARPASQYTTPMIKAGMIELNRYSATVEAKCTFSVIIWLCSGRHASLCISMNGEELAKEISQMSTTNGVVNHIDLHEENGFAMILKYKLMTPISHLWGVRLCAYITS